MPCGRGRGRGAAVRNAPGGAAAAAAPGGAAAAAGDAGGRVLRPRGPPRPPVNRRRPPPDRGRGAAVRNAPDGAAAAAAPGGAAAAAGDAGGRVLRPRGPPRPPVNRRRPPPDLSDGSDVDFNPMNSDDDFNIDDEQNISNRGNNDRDSDDGSDGENRVQNDVQNNRGDGWTFDAFTEHDFEDFRGDRGAVHAIPDETESVEVFNLFWDQTIWDCVVEETNRYVRQERARNPPGLICQNGRKSMFRLCAHSSACAWEWV